MMDWQPEDEFVIPQPDHTVYTNGKGTEQQEISRGTREGVREGNFGANPPVRQRAVSKVRVSGGSGYSTATQWSGTPRRSPESESVSPLSNLGSNYGIA
jgi:hypothetical protein